MIEVVLLTIVIVAIAMIGLAAGVLITGKCLRGTCGGEAVLNADGEDMRCDTCPNKGSENDPCKSGDSVGRTVESH